MERKNLIDANMERAIFMAAVCTARLGGNAGEWQGYSPEEGLNGVLIQDGLLRYARPGHDNGNFAVLFFSEPQLKEIETVDWGKYNVVQEDVVERYRETINKIPGLGYKDVISHTFTKTKTLAESFKLGAELAVKAYFEGSYAGVKGGAEISAKLTTEYQRQWGTEETHTDTVERTIELPADFEGDAVYEAVRSIDKMERTIKATSNIDYGISFVSGPLIPPANHPYFEMNWDSVQQFLDVGSGYAAADKAMYHEFMANKLAQNEIDQIKKLGVQSMEFTLNYDNVTHQDIRIT